MRCLLSTDNCLVGSCLFTYDNSLPESKNGNRQFMPKTLPSLRELKLHVRNFGAVLTLESIGLSIHE